MKLLRKVRKIGKDYMVLIPKKAIEWAGFDEDTEFEYIVSGQKIFLKPLKIKKRKNQKKSD